MTTKATKGESLDAVPGEPRHPALASPSAQGEHNKQLDDNALILILQTYALELDCTTYLSRPAVQRKAIAGFKALVETECIKARLLEVRDITEDLALGDEGATSTPTANKYFNDRINGLEAQLAQKQENK